MRSFADVDASRLAGRAARPVQVLLVAGLLAACAEVPSRPRHLGSAPVDRVDQVLPLVERAAARHGVPRELVLGVIRVESSFNPRAHSSAGARGLMQLMPRTARSLARHLGREDYDIEDPEFNIEAGTFYLAHLLRRFDGDLRLALAGYNAGPVRIRRLVSAGSSLPGYSERYIAAVLAARDAFSRGARPAFEPREASHPELDQTGLRRLIQQQQARYGDRPDEPVELESAASQPAGEARLIQVAPGSTPTPSSRE